VTLFVFLGGATRLIIGPSEIVVAALRVLLPDNGSTSSGGPNTNFNSPTQPNWDPDFGKNCQAEVGNLGSNGDNPGVCQY
jgi:hypothetical protein